MADKKPALGTTILQWHSAEDIPAMHSEEYAGESWLQSEPLLLTDAAGKIAVGYCQESSEGKTEFATACAAQKLGEIRMWALVGEPPLQKEPR